MIATYRFTYNDFPVIVVSELWSGAAEVPLGKDLIEIVKRAGMIVCVCLCDDTSWMFVRHLGLSPDDARKALDQLASDTDAGLGRQKEMGFTFGPAGRE
jgi:hypothetical protein